GEAEVESGMFMTRLLPHRPRERLGDDLAEHHQDFLTPRRGQVRPGLGQWPGKPLGLRARGGTADR
ncbi:hypothetical protein, partial [Singulisphaera acidiphila]|uniref:hypothetical protein n=1 Tax=Singulisphaera acidiphila TaxID=466153 RepID=UPI001ED93193